MALTAFRIGLIVAWIIVVGIAVAALRELGAQAALDVFLADLHHPWRAQFNMDFAFHLLLGGTWLIYRARSWPVGLGFAALVLCTGGATLFAYILIVSIQVKGDMRKLLLGRHA